MLMGVPMLFFVSGGIFLNSSPEFGGTHSAMDKKRYAASANHVSGKFQNILPTDMSMSARDMAKTMYDFMKGADDLAPKNKIPVLHPDSALIASPPEAARLVWFGHSAFLLQIDGKNILIDPMFGPVPAPHPWLGKASGNIMHSGDLGSLFHYIHLGGLSTGHGINDTLVADRGRFIFDRPNSHRSRTGG